FVMNHTSDQHPWFQESRRNPVGPYADYYVWSDTDELYHDARVIFVDTEPSNWTWDPVRQQYFWHRFFSHQPDLNFDNPRVHEAMLEAMSFWLDMGLDGFRLDAVPYLYERPGTNGENLPETHEFLRERLAPLLDNDVNRMELFTALLLSLPGSPVIYYGDEIGMGDNIWLGDRDGVRTPMQWTPDRNAGFSSATPGKLHLPTIQDPVYGYQSVNVEAQLEDSSSLLQWTRRMIHARRGHPAFGVGGFLDL